MRPTRPALSILLYALIVAVACSEPTPNADLPKAEPNVSDADFLTRATANFSQQREEVIIRHFFRDRREGVFLDVGCAHYAKMSTTFYLEKELGWRGVGVDAIKRWGAAYEEHRPNTVFVNRYVSDTSDESEKFYVAKHLPWVSSGDRDFAKRLSKRFAGKDDVVETEVKTITLNDLLERAEIKKVDLLSMDIEGHELPALAGFDMARFKPDLVVIETAHDTDNRVDAHMRKNGYEAIELYRPYDEVNSYYRPAKNAPAPELP
jgi:FkbM family methyltransferase